MSSFWVIKMFILRITILKFDFTKNINSVYY